MRRFPACQTILLIVIAMCASVLASCVNSNYGSIVKQTQTDRLWVVDGTLSKDHQTVVAVNQDGVCSVYSLTIGEPIFDLEETGNDRFLKGAMSPDGKILAAIVLTDNRNSEGILMSSAYELRLYSTETGKILKVIVNGNLEHAIVEYSANGDILGFCMPGLIRLWSAKNGKMLRVIEPKMMKDPDRGRALFKISPDSKYVAYYAEKRVDLWSVENGEFIFTIIGNGSSIVSVAFSPDSKTIAFGHSDESICLNSTSSGELIRVINRKTDNTRYPSLFFNLEFSPDGQVLAAGEDSGKGAIKLWSVESGELLKDNMFHTQTDPGYSCGVTFLSFSPDGKNLVSFSCGEMKEWNLEKINTSTPVNNQKIESVPAQIDKTKLSECTKFVDDSIFTLDHEEGHRLQFNPDGKTFATWNVNSPAQLYSTSTGQLLHSFGISNGGTEDIAFSQKGDMIAIAGAHGTLTLWITDTGKMLRKFEVISGPFDAISFSPDGQYLLVAAGNDLKRWSVGTGKPVRDISAWAYETPVIRYSSDRKVFGVYTFSTLTINSSTNGKVLMDIEEPVRSYGGFDFSPDSKNVAFIESEWKIRIKEISTGKDLFEYSKSEHYFWYIMFTPDGKSLIAFDLSNDFYRISLETGEIVQTFRGHLERLTGGDINPDGKLIVTESQDKTIKFWKVNPYDSLPIENRKEEKVLIVPSQLMPSPEFHGWEYDTDDPLMRLKP